MLHERVSVKGPSHDAKSQGFVYKMIIKLLNKNLIKYNLIPMVWNFSKIFYFKIKVSDSYYRKKTKQLFTTPFFKNIMIK